MEKVLNMKLEDELVFNSAVITKLVTLSRSRSFSSRTTGFIYTN